MPLPLHGDGERLVYAFPPLWWWGEACARLSPFVVMGRGLCTPLPLCGDGERLVHASPPFVVMGKRLA